MQAITPLFLDTAEHLLVAGVDAGRAASCEQDDKREGKVPIVIQLERDPGDVVIAGEGEGPQALLEVDVSARCPGNLKKLRSLRELQTAFQSSYRATAPAIDTTGEPVLHHRNDIVPHLRSDMVEDDESVVNVERLVCPLRTSSRSSDSVRHGID